MTQQNLVNSPHLQPDRHRKRWISEGDITCSGPGCTQGIPAGYYSKRKSMYLCSRKCDYQYHRASRPKNRCAQCRGWFKPSNNGNKQRFCTPECFASWRRRQTDSRVGPYKRVFNEFVGVLLAQFLAPSTENSARCYLSSFFEYLCSRRIRSLNSVTPLIITEYLQHLRKSRVKSPARPLSTVKALFDWLIVEGKRQKSNPVISRFHSQKPVHRLPRPYSTQELANIWRILRDHGDVMLMAAVSLGQEAGIRISECANLRVQDVDLVSQVAFIKLPNKTRRERYVPFHQTAKGYLTEWLSQRGSRQHDSVFVNEWGGPISKHVLRRKLNKVLCGPGKLDDFSFHRLRHSAATALKRGGADILSISKTIGWQDPGVAAAYTEVLTDEVRDAYDRAMTHKPDASAARKSVQSLDDFFANESANPR